MKRIIVALITLGALSQDVMAVSPRGRMITRSAAKSAPVQKTGRTVARKIAPVKDAPVAEKTQKTGFENLAVRKPAPAKPAVVKTAPVKRAPVVKQAPVAPVVTPAPVVEAPKAEQPVVVAPIAPIVKPAPAKPVVVVAPKQEESRARRWAKRLAKVAVVAGVAYALDRAQTFARNKYNNNSGATPFTHQGYGYASGKVAAGWAKVFKS